MLPKHISTLKATIILLMFVVFAFSISSHGMFMDGLWYADIAKNLSNNNGSFWDLYFTETLFTKFREHPPLQMWLHSFLYKIFGENIIIDKVYGILCFVVVVVLIDKIWKNLVEDKYKVQSWLPILFYVSMPIVNWAAVNNILENTMSLFTLSSTFFLLKYYKSKKIQYLFFASICLVFAFLSKGFTSLYIILFPFFYIIILEKKIIKALRHTMFFLCISFFLLIILFYFNQASFDYIKEYFYKQIVFSLTNVITVKTRFYIVFKLLTELLPTFGLCFCFYFINKTKVTTKTKKDLAIVFTLVGFSGVLPIMVSLKQSGFYILTTFPFFALGIALYMKDFVIPFQTWISSFEKNLIKINYVLMCLSIFISIIRYQKICRDKELIEDVFTITKIIPNGSKIKIPKLMNNDWLLHGYLHRYGNLSLDTSQNKIQFLLTYKQDSMKNGLYKTNKKLNNLTLYIQK